MRQLRSSPEVPIAMSADEFRAAGHRLIDEIADFLQSIPARRVVPPGGPDEIRAVIDGDASLPEHGTGAATLLTETARILFDHSTLNAHPRFFGYITAGPAPIGVLADLLAAAVNPNCGGWTLSPIASEIEVQTVRWLSELIGYHPECGGLLVSGGNMANFTCFLAARAAMADWDVRKTGLTEPAARRLFVYASAETHTWIQKAVDLFGLGTNAIRWIPTDASLRMDAAALRRCIQLDLAAGHQPLMVVGTAGSVSTGAIDPLPQIAEVCREFRIWFHVDGAYGGFAAAVPEAAPDLAALRAADSVAVDPHKWLYAPLEAGCALVRDRNRLREAFSYHPPYYHFGVEATNFVDLGPQNSRGFRALKVWLAIRQAGRTGYRRMIGDDIRLARHLYDTVAVHPDLQAFTHSLSITTFRFVPAELRPHIGEPEAEEELNRINETLLDQLQKGGAAFVSNAVVRGSYVLRACIVNFNTTKEDVEALPGIVVQMGKGIRANESAVSSA